MIRLLRTASLLVAFYLLTSVATAYAECAWVLWSVHIDEQRADGRIVFNRMAFGPVEAFATKRECVKQLEEMQQTGGSSSFERRCLPDTVDPRGPKGK